MVRRAFRDAYLYALWVCKRFVSRVDENMVLLYVTLKYFNSDRDMDTLLAGNKNAVDLNLIYSLLSI